MRKWFLQKLLGELFDLTDLEEERFQGLLSEAQILWEKLDESNALS